MSSSLSFRAYSKLFTTKLRARMHNQSFTSTVMERERIRITTGGRIALQRVDELVKLKVEHQSSFDPTLRVRALQSLQTLPLLSADEDPHFVQSLRALRVAAYFRAVQSPSTFALLNHITKHTYMLDGFNLYHLSATLLELQHPQTAEVLNIIRPRIYQVVLNYDVTAVEAVLFLHVLYKFHLDDSVLIQKLADIIQHTISDLPLVDVTRCISALPFTRSKVITQRILSTAEGKLCELLEEAVTNYRVYCGGFHDGFESLSTLLSTEDKLNGMTSRRKEVQEMLLNNAKRSRTLIRELSRTVMWAHQAPRRLMNGLICAALVYSERNVSQEVLKSVIVKDETHRACAEVTEACGPSSTTPLVQSVEKVEDIQDLCSKTLPFLSRHDICLLMKALCEVHYRHERALLILASRAAIASSSRKWNTTDQDRQSPSGSLLHGVSPSAPPLETLQDLSLAVECLAYFYLLHARCTVAALLQEVDTLVRDAVNPLLLTPAVEALSRLMVSLARLHYPAAAVAAEASGDIAVLESTCTCEPITRYCMSPYCAQDPLLASHLLSGLVQVCVQIQKPQDTAAVDPLPVRKRSILVSHLLKALSPSFLDDAVSRETPSISARMPLNHVRDEIAASVELIQANPSAFDLSIMDPALEELRKQ
ncbi:unnamed protein product [Phytomonas sp. EM1]|nr:unnamed protein product [Phytomonas sp. EM1]|eukprot:CCW60326.1 unnamed protein product [Phytomonas sp. isolate EM1]